MVKQVAKRLLLEGNLAQQELDICAKNTANDMKTGQLTSESPKTEVTTNSDSAEVGTKPNTILKLFKAPSTKQGLDMTAISSLLMLLIICLLIVCRQRVLVGEWLD